MQRHQPRFVALKALRRGAIGKALIFVTLSGCAVGAFGNEWDEGAPSAPATPTSANPKPAAAASDAADHHAAMTTFHVSEVARPKRATVEDEQGKPADQGAQAKRMPEDGYASPNWSNYYGVTDAIRADTQKAQAELENLKVHHELDQARNGVFDQSGTTSTGGNGAPYSIARLQPQLASAGAGSVSHGPLVHEVRMVDGRWAANVELGTGAHVWVHQGEAVRGAGTVESISLHQVMTVNAGKRTALQFADEVDASVPVAPSVPSSVRAVGSPVMFGPN